MPLPQSLTFDQTDRTLRSDIKSWFAFNAPPSTGTGYKERMLALIEWQAMLHAAGWIGLSWPVKYGGRGLGLASEAIVAEELAQTNLPELINRLALYTWGPTILQFGSEEQRRRYLRPMLDASEIWCQAFSEPDAGSDLASVRTVGRKVPGGLRVTGQKVWTSRAEISRWGAMLVRTSQTENPRHGLSIVIVDMRDTGVQVRPLLQILHEPHFSELFLEDAFVPDENVLGGVGNGWRVAMAAMGFERGLFVLERRIRLSRRLDELAARVSPSADRHVHARLGHLKANLDILQAQVYRTLAEQGAGKLVAGSTSIDKLMLARVDQELFAIAFDLLGSEVAFSDDGWTHDLLTSRSVSIYSGTSEIQREIIAKQLLGLGGA